MILRRGFDAGQALGHCFAGRWRLGRREARDRCAPARHSRRRSRPLPEVFGCFLSPDAGRTEVGEDARPGSYSQGTDDGAECIAEPYDAATPAVRAALPRAPGDSHRL